MKNRVLLILTAVELLGVHTALADPLGFYIQHLQRQRHTLFGDTLSPPAGSLATGWFEQLLNPSDSSDPRTFQQRYFIDSSYATGADDPVFYITCGEAACSQNDFSGTISRLAHQYHAHLVALEHRYYGKSQPFPQLTGDTLKYLSTEYALKDLARFEDYARAHLGLKGKWVAMGASYPGSLSALYRSQYPQEVVGAIASSAPVRAKANFEEYDLTVATVAGPQCASAMRKVTRQLEKDLSDPAAFKKDQAAFGADKLADPIDFLAVVADMGATAVQYGFHDEFCAELLGASDPLAGYAKGGAMAFARFGTTVLQDSIQGVESSLTSDYETGLGYRQWMYQTCTEWGYFQTAYHDPEISVRSRLIDLDYSWKACARLFGPQARFDENATNTSFYQPLLNPSTSHIIFTNGQDDPWSKLSISQELGNATNPNTVAVTISGAAHGEDLYGGSSPDLEIARGEIQKLLSEWLQ